MKPHTECPACNAGRIHTDAEWIHHPLAMHGYANRKWSDPRAEEAHLEEARQQKPEVKRATT